MNLKPENKTENNSETIWDLNGCYFLTKHLSVNLYKTLLLNEAQKKN